LKQHSEGPKLEFEINMEEAERIFGRSIIGIDVAEYFSKLSKFLELGSDCRLKLNIRNFRQYLRQD
jgi:hypothetical protein